MTFLLSLLFLILFYGSLVLGKWLTTKNNSILSIGEKIYLNKTKQLKTSYLFSPVRSAIADRLITKAFFVIFPLIVLKSIAFYFIALVLITPLVLIFQGITMGSLFIYYKTHIGAINKLQRITFWQLLSHIIAASFGTSLGLKWLYYKEVDINKNVLLTNESLMCFILIVMTAIIAAYLEAKLIVKEE